MTCSPAAEAGQVVQRYYAAVDHNDIQALLALFTDDAVYRRPGYPTFVGRDALARFYGSTRVIASGRHSLETIIAEPAEVAVRGSFKGHSRDGHPLAVRFADFFRIKNGMILERNSYFDAPAI
jgi:ketosteroid isomerase-like protein